MSFHLSSLRNQIVEHLIITHPIDWEEDKDPTSDQRPTNLINEQIIPVGLKFVAAMRRLIRRLRRFKVELVSNADPEDFEGVKNDGTTRRASNVSLSSGNEDSQCEEENAERKKIGGPEINFGLELGRC